MQKIDECCADIEGPERLACGKIVYRDKRSAMTARNARMKRRRRRPDYLRAYYCKWCNGWHLTSKHDEE